MECIPFGSILEDAKLNWDTLINNRIRPHHKLRSIWSLRSNFVVIAICCLIGKNARPVTHPSSYYVAAEDPLKKLLHNLHMVTGISVHLLHLGNQQQLHSSLLPITYYIIVIIMRRGAVCRERKRKIQPRRAD